MDVIVYKLSAEGRALLYATYFGGARPEDSSGHIAVDRAGRIYLSGYTGSHDSPLTPDALFTSLRGWTDAFCAVIDPARPGWEALPYSSYLGGGAYDYAQSIGIDAAGNIYLAGFGNATNQHNDFPTVNAFGYSLRTYSAAPAKRGDCRRWWPTGSGSSHRS